MGTTQPPGGGDLDLVLTGLDHYVELLPAAKTAKKGPVLPKNTVSAVSKIRKNIKKK